MLLPPCSSFCLHIYSLPIIIILYQNDTLLQLGSCPILLSSTRMIHLLQLGSHHLHLIITKIIIYTMCSNIVCRCCVCSGLHALKCRLVLLSTCGDKGNLKCHPHLLSSYLVWERICFFFLAVYTNLADPIFPTGILRSQMLLVQGYVGSGDSNSGSQTCIVLYLQSHLPVFHVFSFVWGLCTFPQCIAKYT